MSRIIINEDDRTATAEGSLGEVVFVAGFSTNNHNAYVVNKATGASGAAPADTTQGSVFTDGDTPSYRKNGDKPTLFINTNTKQSWKCTAITVGESATTYTWIATTEYVEPDNIGKGNAPELCRTVAEFQNKFGSTPYKFTADQNVSALCGTNTFADSEKFRKNGEVDLSYVYAMELLNNGIQVVYSNQTHIGDDGLAVAQQIAAMCANVGTALEAIEDKGTYNVKYITLGAYPSYEMYNASASTSGRYQLADKLTGVASNRGDCIALVDHGTNPARPFIGANSVIASLRDTTASGNPITHGEYGAMFTPNAVYAIADLGNGIDGEYVMPASFAYLLCLARTIKTNPNWLAMSGVSRSVVPYLKSIYSDTTLTNTIADDFLQSDTEVSINPITNIRGYGQTIWGNRTLKGAPMAALSYLNLRNLVSDVKKTVYDSATYRMFEPNTDVLWLNFKSDVMPLLDRMKTGQGIKNYKFIQQATDSKTKLKALIKLYPVYAVENFEITVSLTDESVEVE